MKGRNTGAGGARTDNRRSGAAVLSTLLITGVVLLAACTPPAPQVQPEVRSASAAPHASCRTFAVDTCVLPFPSDQYTVPDSTSATGLRPAIDRSLLSEGVFEALPASFQPETFFGSADGFSPVGSVSFELSAAVDAGSLLAGPDRYVSAVDHDTGAVVPILVDVSPDGEGRLIHVWPRSRWAFGHRITVSISAALPAATGAPLARPAGWDASLIPPTAFAPDDTLTSTTFTVRSEGDVKNRVTAMAQTAWDSEHPVRDIEVLPMPLPNVSAFIRGQVRVSDFRTHDSEIDLTDPGPPVDSWIDFEIAYPEHPKFDTGAPLAVYGHGLAVVKETALVVSFDNAARGWATVSIDHPNHGSRGEAEGALVDLVEPRHLGRVASLVTQSSMDFISLQKALHTSIAELDVVTRDVMFAESAAPDGLADFDPSAMIYQGTSMGGVLGAAYLSLTPQPIAAAMLQVPGVGITHILTNSLLWDGVLAFRGVVPEAATPGETAALISTAQMALDGGDAANWIDVAMAKGTQILVDYGIGDGIVPNRSTERLLEIAGIPLGGTIVAPVDHLTVAPGLGAEQVGAGASSSLTWATQVPNDVPIDVLEPFLGHLAFLQPAATESQRRWMDAVDRMFEAPGEADR